MPTAPSIFDYKGKKLTYVELSQLPECEVKVATLRGNVHKLRKVIQKGLDYYGEITLTDEQILACMKKKYVRRDNVGSGSQYVEGGNDVDGRGVDDVGKYVEALREKDAELREIDRNGGRRKHRARIKHKYSRVVRNAMLDYEALDSSDFHYLLAKLMPAGSLADTVD